MTIQRLVFIRPGETDWNRNERWQGHVAVPLNANGRRQAEQLAKYVRNTGMSALYTSDLCRAVETATIIATGLGFSPIEDARLRERGVGIWQGLSRDEIAAWYPQEYAQLQADPEHYCIPGGESRHDVQLRVHAAVDEILSRENDEVVGILSHTTALRTLLPALVPDYDTNRSQYSNMSVTTIGRSGSGAWSLLMLDDVRHLEGLTTMHVDELEVKPHDSGH